MIPFLSLLALASSSASPPTLAHDIRCMTAMSMMQTMPGTDPDGQIARRAGGIGEIYYLGRIDARAPDIDLAKAMKTARASIIADGNLSATLQGCGVAMRQRLDTLTAGMKALGDEDLPSK